MTCFKWLALCLIAVMTIGVSAAQQKFPLRSGEWSATTPDPTPGHPPFVMLYCLNDELWTKALNSVPSCKIQQFSVTPVGGSYSLDCSGASFQMKGNVKLTFDGMTHMTSRGAFDTTMAGGKTSHTDSTSEYHWKGATCNPNVDMNLKDFNKPQQ